MPPPPAMPVGLAAGHRPRPAALGHADASPRPCRRCRPRPRRPRTRSPRKPRESRFRRFHCARLVVPGSLFAGAADGGAPALGARAAQPGDGAPEQRRCGTALAGHVPFGPTAPAAVGQADAARPSRRPHRAARFSRRRPSRPSRRSTPRPRRPRFPPPRRWWTTARSPWASPPCCAGCPRRLLAVEPSSVPDDAKHHAAVCTGRASD